MKNPIVLVLNLTMILANNTTIVVVGSPMNAVICIFIPIKSYLDFPNFLIVEKSDTFSKTPLFMKARLIGLPFITTFTYNFKCCAWYACGLCSLAIPFSASRSSAKLTHSPSLARTSPSKDANNYRNMGII